MGLTKQYLRYIATDVFGVIVSGRSNVAFLNIDGIADRYAVAGGAENVLVWDLKTSEKCLQISNENKQEVVRVATSPDFVHLAIGLSDGSVQIYNCKSQTTVCHLSLHRTAINCLRFDENGLKLASGGLDTDIIVSDIITQAGSYRLQGHKGPITDIKFMSRFDNILISCSKDTQVGLSNLTLLNLITTVI